MFEVDDGGVCFQAMVPMRDSVRLNTFVFLPDDGNGTYPVILQRTPYGITATPGQAVTDPRQGWLPSDDMPMFGPLLRGWKQAIARGYAMVYQDCRGRYGSEGVDRAYGDDAADGYDTLDWIAAQPWSNSAVGLSGSSGAAITAMAAASLDHPSVKAMFAQVGSASIYEDVVYEGGSIEMERLWLWVGNNIAGLSESHRTSVMTAAGMTREQFESVAEGAAKRVLAMGEAAGASPPFVESPAWMQLPPTGDRDLSGSQPYFDEMITHPLPDEFRLAHQFRATISVPCFHATSWYDVFLNSVIETYQALQARVGNQRLWIGPNTHSYIYEEAFWPRDPYFEWFDYWLRAIESPLSAEPPVYYSPVSWVDNGRNASGEWVTAAQWPPLEAAPEISYLGADGSLGHSLAPGRRAYRYDPRRPIPTQGGRNLIIPGGPADQRSVRELADYGLIYEGAKLTNDLRCLGLATVELFAESDCPDTDFVAKLIDVHPDGRALLVADGVIRAMCRDGRTAQPLTPGVVVPVTIDLGYICHTFARGHRVAVDITSSNFPRRIRNSNSGNLVLARDGDGDIRIASNTVHHGRSNASRLILPVVDR